MLVREVMTHKVLTAGSDWTLAELKTFLLEHSISGAPVVDAHGKLVGVVSATDVMRSAKSVGSRSGGIGVRGRRTESRCASTHGPRPRKRFATSDPIIRPRPMAAATEAASVKDSPAAAKPCATSAVSHEDAYTIRMSSIHRARDPGRITSYSPGAYT